MMKPIIGLTMTPVLCEGGGVMVRHDTSRRVLLTLQSTRRRSAVVAVMYFPARQEKRLSKLIDATKRYRLTLLEEP